MKTKTWHRLGSEAQTRFLHSVQAEGASPEEFRKKRAFMASIPESKKTRYYFA